MPERYKNKYRIESARAQWWNYGWNGAYFITICTKNQEHFFGEVKNGKMVLSPCGVIANILWYEIPNHVKHVELGEFVVMPNHIHGIIILDKPMENDNVETLHATSVPHNANDEKPMHATSVRDNAKDEKPMHATSVLQNANDEKPMHATSVRDNAKDEKPMHATSVRDNAKDEKPIHATSVRDNSKDEKHMAVISPKANTVSAIIRSYKSAVSKHANRLELENGWHARFHDHIIRNYMEYQRIADYIINNPAKWEEDKFY